MPQHLLQSIHEDAEGNLTVGVQRISSVGIKNIGYVEHYEVNTLFGSRSHVVRFVNGGVLQFAYNDKNEIIELCSTGLTLHLSTAGAAMFDVVG